MPCLGFLPYHSQRRSKRERRAHNKGMAAAARGWVLADLAVAIADGTTTISEIDTLRHQVELLGSVASDTTGWRALEKITPA